MAPKEVLRWRFLIKPSLQARYTVFVFLSMLGIVVFVAWNTYFTVGKSVFGEITDPRALSLFRQLNWTLMGWLLVYTVALVVVSIFLSHKFAGPVYRFENSAEEIGRGRLRHRISLRRSDELTDLQEKLNAMVESLQRKVAQDRALRDEVLKRLQLLEAELPASAQAKLKEAEAAAARITQDFEI